MNATNYTAGEQRGTRLPLKRAFLLGGLAVGRDYAEPHAFDGSTSPKLLINQVHMRPFKCVHQLFESCVARNPNRLAVSCADCVMTYGELNERADVLANQLRALGARPETLIGLCARRSPALMVGVLGILKSGAAYLPLDPSEPTLRTNAMLDDAGVSVVVLDETACKKLDCGRRQVIHLEQNGGMKRVGSGERVARAGDGGEVGSKNLAYVIYTSGSTGTPKGVEITHESLSNLVQWHRNAFQVTPEDRATCIARISFDACVWEVWPYLAAGASLHIPSEEKLNDPQALQSWLVAEEITITFVPTPIAERLLASEWPASTRLRVMLTGGDALHMFPTDDLPFAVVNNYGPTECTVVATSGSVPKTKVTNRLPSIGNPIANTKVYLLNDDLAEVPFGAAGEMYIGGVGVARGYRNRPDLTAERFIPNPFNPEQGRLFRTGDRAQFLHDGQIAFLGRLDEQVKIRGFRIEPGEIVAVLDEHPLISQSAVVARETTPGELQLVAYIVPKGSAVPAVAELREFLLARLPDYMVPATFVKLDTIPVTRHGKVDRAALPAPDTANTIGEAVLNEPQTEIETIVARTLAPLLGLPAVDVQANFFALGAHSLLGTQLISRLRESMGVELTLRTLFEAPSVVELAEVIERQLCAKLQPMGQGATQQTFTGQTL